MIARNIYFKSSRVSFALVILIFLSKVTAIEQKIYDSDPSEYGHFGWEVEIYGDYVFVGTPHNASSLDNFLGGQVSVYKTNNDGVVEPHSLILASDASAHDKFGHSIDVSSDGMLLIVGATGDKNENGIFAGAAYIFRFDESGQNWVEEQKLIQPDGSHSKRFGGAVAVSNDFVAVGAPYGSGAQLDDFSGSVHIYQFDGSAWVHVQKFHGEERLDHFGCSVEMDEATLAVGAYYGDGAEAESGEVYIYDYSTENSEIPWILNTVVEPEDGQKGDRFGFSLSLDGGRLAIGAPDDQNVYEAGSAYIYKKDDSDIWSQEIKMLPSSGRDHEYFGTSVKLHGDRLLIAASRYDDGLVLNEGAVYLYHLNDNSWVNNSIISPRDSQLNGHFGLSVDMNENNIIVGSRLDDDQGKDAGAAYIYNSVFVSIGGLDLNIEYGHTGDLSATFDIINFSGADIDWSETHASSWIVLAPGSGTIPGGENIQLEGSLNLEGLEVGVFQDTLVFSFSQEGLADLSVPVNLELIESLENAPENIIPRDFALSQNYPNPFNPVTTIQYSLPKTTFVNLTIYDLLGREVKTLLNGIEQPGIKQIKWNSTNNTGKMMASGIYLLRIHTEEFTKSKKMVLLR